MSRIKLIASDLDGTLIPEGERELESGFIEAIKEKLNEGYRFYTATGRPYSGALHLFEEIRDEIGFICENGSLIMEKGEVTFVNEITPALAEAVCDFLIPDSRVEVLISGVKDRYIAPKKESFRKELAAILKKESTVISCYEDIREPIIKIAMQVSDFDKDAENMKAELYEKFGDSADFVFTGNGWLDMIVLGHGKGTALKYIMDREGFIPEEVIVFGDNENDISMFEHAAISYAKDHSKEHVKERATHSCSSVTKVIEELK